MGHFTPPSLIYVRRQGQLASPDTRKNRYPRENRVVPFRCNRLFVLNYWSRPRDYSYESFSFVHVRDDKRVKRRTETWTDLNDLRQTDRLDLQIFGPKTGKLKSLKLFSIVLTWLESSLIRKESLKSVYCLPICTSPLLTILSTFWSSFSTWRKWREGPLGPMFRVGNGTSDFHTPPWSRKRSRDGNETLFLVGTVASL